MTKMEKPGELKKQKEAIKDVTLGHQRVQTVKCFQMFSVALSGTAEPNKLIDKCNSLNCRQPAQAHTAML